MKGLVAVCLLGALLSFPPSVQAVTALSLQEGARMLADPAQQKATLESLRQNADPQWRAVLLALKEGALYSWNGKLLILDEEGNYAEVGGKPLLDAEGKPLTPEEGLEQVSLEEANIPLLQQVVDLIDLFNGTAEARKAVALKLANLRDMSLTHVLEQAQGREQAASVKAALVAAIDKLRLSDPDPQVRRRAVEAFGASRSEAALGTLRDLLQTEPNAEVKSAIGTAVGRIEWTLRVRSVVGYAFNGLSLASILLIMSIGLAVTFGLMGIINMAHGEMLMLGSYTAYVIQEMFGRHWPLHQDYYFLVALPLSVVTVGAVGLVLERCILRYLYGRPLESLLVTWGIGMMLQQGARLYFGDQTSVSPPTWFRGGVEVMPGLIFPYSRIFIIALSLACLAAVGLLLYRSTVGLRIRAVMQNRDMAACMGISTRRVDAFTFALGTALAGVAGCALSLIGTVDPEVGKTYIVDSFMVVVLGGVGKLLGTVLASFGIGMSNKLLEPAIGGTAAAVYSKVAILAAVIFFLQLRPTGLFPAKERGSETR